MVRSSGTTNSDKYKIQLYDLLNMKSLAKYTIWLTIPNPHDPTILGPFWSIVLKAAFYQLYARTQVELIYKNILLKRHCTTAVPTELQ